ncbi:MAG: ImmA/IrrE family metallo-endopeptidase [Rhodococcus sp. (in: high G+C Gram-positive bacteria)]|nr:MAG: ImmA/IrrE family metallo-endopeptidase [Rhodococcus sp. (in: high G+C Gram-positive bacteria)]
MRSAEISARVRELIQRSGMSAGEFAGHVGLDAPKMSRSLSGERRFTSLNLAKIAEFSGTSVDWIMGTEQPTPALAARHDSVESTQDAGTQAAIEKATYYARLRGDLADLGYPQRPTDFKWQDRGRSYVTSGEKLATEAISHLRAKGHDHTSDRGLVDLIEEAFEVDVAVEKLGGSFEGLTWRDSNCRLIVIAVSSIPGRRRFTLAHELAHLLAEDDQELTIDKAGERHPSEVMANTFAASFLMPEDVLLEHIGDEPLDQRCFARLSCELFVTPRTLSWRLFNLRLIDDAKRRTFGAMRTMDAAVMAGQTAEFSSWIEDSLIPRVPQLLIEDSGRAYLDGKTTLRPLANLVGVDVNYLRNALETERSEFEPDLEEEFGDVAEVGVRAVS